MARKSKNRSRNPYIIIFWEGESEEQYFKFLKDRFHEKANLNIHNKKGLFAVADKAFSAKGIYADDVLDEYSVAAKPSVRKNGNHLSG